MSYIFALLVLLVSTLALPQDKGDETKVIAFENLWNQMQINHDADAMEKMLDSDFVFTDYDGKVMSKSQFLTSIRDRSNQLTVEASEDMKLYRHGDTLIVIGATHEKGALNGRSYQHKGRFTDTWVRQNGTWICIASQLALLSK